jgi:cytochrome c553
MMRGAAIVAVAAMAALPAWAAGDPPPGAVACSGCHPPSASEAMPAIYGRDPAELLGLMLAFRDGTRPASVMDRLMRGFSPDELRSIADWVGTQP